ncbi:CLUMA_CG019926, isoform A [Clunio marinus]|uniref:CLUMA_CG019926, isoform A n=1 Tax=Clunio marinus TaxID=568069 RepID=A0A1J1J1M8_9DIPT|nr:CLUMA_CG019926, isoform A [Clunio marinus]
MNDLRTTARVPLKSRFVGAVTTQPTNSLNATLKPIKCLTVKLITSYNKNYRNKFTGLEMR